MPQETSQLTPRETRKQMLLAESELLRAELVQELRGLKVEICQITHPLKQFGEFVETAAKAGATFTAWRKLGTLWTPPASGKLAWLPKLYRGIKLGTAVWFAVRTVRRATTKDGPLRNNR